MRKCLECGEDVEDNSVFCQNCGSKLDTPVIKEVKTNNNVSKGTYEANKINLMIVMGYLTLFIQFVAILASWFNVKVINSDRIILYPLLCVILSFFVASKLIENEKTLIHAAIVVVGSIILFIFGII